MLRTSYDETVLQDFADTLYKRAAWVVLSTTVLYAVIGLIVGVALMAVLAKSGTSPPRDWLLFGPLAGVVVGFLIGRGRAFKLRLEAQRTFCQISIERNTRLAREALGARLTAPVAN